MSLVIMDTFKGQDNSVFKQLFEKHFCEVVIVRHNLRNKSQQLGWMAKEHNNTWMAKELSN